MNPLIILSDIVDLSNRGGFVIVRNGFKMVKDKPLDLGFAFQNSLYDNKKFYSIPILSYDWSPDIDRIYSDCRILADKTRRERFLINTNKTRYPKLIEAFPESPIVRSAEYGLLKYFDIRKKDAKIAGHIQQIRRDFEELLKDLVKRELNI